MNANKFFLMTAALALLLAGCGGQDTTPSDEGAVTGPVNSGPGTFVNEGNSGPGVFVPLYTGETPADRAQRENLIVYFEFDRSEIRSEFNAMLAAHGEYLAADPALTIRLEGHADERGSREYNIGLGERRALAVRQILLLQGAQASQVTTVSYGEERPAALGSDEESYGLNRRVELIYR